MKNGLSLAPRGTCGWTLPLALLVLSAFAVPCAAQSVGSEVVGEVTSGGSGVAGAVIRLSGSSEGATSDRSGRFRLAEVPAGAHTLEVRHLGFEPARLAITVRAGETTAVSFELEPRVHALEGVVVTGQFAPTEARNSIYRVRTMDREAIDQRGATDVAGLLQQEMNARVLQDNVLGRVLILQGLSGQNVKVLLDGVPLITGDANQLDLGQLNLNQVERVEIVEGPLSVQYGTNALAGTVNLITRKPEGDRVSLSGASYVESVGQYNLDAGVSGSVGRLRVQATAARNRFEGYSSFPADRSKNWNPKTQYLGGVRAMYPLGSLRLALAQNLFHEEAVGLGIPTRTPTFAIANDRYYTTLRNQTDLFLTGWLSEHRYLDLVAGRQSFDRENARYLVNLADNTRRRTDEPSDHGNSAFSTWAIRGTGSQAGLAGNRLALQFGYDLNLHEAAGERVSHDRSSITDAGLFVSMNLKPVPALEIQPGLRYLYNNLYDAAEVDFLGVGLPVVPSLSVRLSPTGGTQFRASYARGFRAPSLRELYYYFHDANHSIDGNPDLLPETAHNLTLSARHTLHLGGARLVLEPSVFDNRIRDQIYLLNKLTLRPEDENKVAKTYFNISRFRTRGANLGASLESGLLSLRPAVGVLSRSGTRSQRQDFHSLEGSLAATYRPAAGFSLNAFHKYSGPIAEFSLLEGRVVDRRLDGYHLLDLSASRAFARRGITLTAGAKNLLGVTDVAQTGEGQDGVLLRGSARQTIPVAWGRSAFLKADWVR